MKQPLASLLFFSIILAFSSCDQPEPPQFVEVSSVQKIKITKNENLTVGFQATILWFSSCGTYDHFDKNIDGDDVYISVYGNQYSTAVCDEGAFYSFIADFEVETENAGPHHFHFWRTETLTLDTLINVID